jgi:hypothetical protein
MDAIAIRWLTIYHTRTTSFTNWEEKFSECTKCNADNHHWVHKLDYICATPVGDYQVIIKIIKERYSLYNPWVGWELQCAWLRTLAKRRFDVRPIVIYINALLWQPHHRPLRYSSRESPEGGTPRSSAYNYPHIRLLEVISQLHFYFVHISVYGSTALADLGRFFSFFNLYTVGRTPWTGHQPVARLLPTHRTTQRQNKRTHTSMPRVGFEPRIPVYESEDGSCLRPRGHCDRLFTYKDKWGSKAKRWVKIWGFKRQFIKLVSWLTVFNFVKSEFAELISTELLLLVSHDWKQINPCNHRPNLREESSTMYKVQYTQGIKSTQSEWWRCHDWQTSLRTHQRC